MKLIEKLLCRFFWFYDITGTLDNSLYLRRWFIVRAFGRKICVHKIVRPDGDRCRHDHPWNFVTLVLFGGYVEELRDGKSHEAKPFRLYKRSCSHSHRITSLPRSEAWTMVFMGRDQREWGFFTKLGWMAHQKFLSDPNKSAEWCGGAA